MPPSPREFGALRIASAATRLRGGLLFAVVCGLTVGCAPATQSTGDRPQPPAEERSTPPEASAPTPSPTASDPPAPPTAPEPEFQSAAEAIAALVAAAESADTQRVYLINRWIGRHPAECLGPVEELLAAESSSTASLIAACRAFAAIGPPARPALRQAARHSQQLVRVNAIKALLAIKPWESETLTLLITLTEHEDQRTQYAALQGLGQMGGQAERAAPRLQEILDDGNADNGVRQAAGQALRRVAPRKTFDDR